MKDNRRGFSIRIADYLVHMKQFVVLFLMSILLPGYADEDRILGKWVLVHSTFAIPESCRGLWYEFTAEGKLLSGDGSLSEVKKYQVKPFNHGMHIKTTYVSNNGQPNCQGLASSDVKENTLNIIYAEFGNEGGELKLFFGDDSNSEYITLRKQ